MDGLLDTTDNIFGKNPLLKFGERHLNIEYKSSRSKRENKRISYNEITEFKYLKPLHFGSFLLGIIYTFLAFDVLDLRSHIEIRHRIDGDEAKTTVNGKFNAEEIEQMKAIIKANKT